jgi:hypothetical protein
MLFLNKFSPGNSDFTKFKNDLFQGKSGQEIVGEKKVNPSSVGILKNP